MRAVRRLVADNIPAAHHAVEWNGTSDRGGSVASGIYFSRLVAEDRETMQKRVLVK